MASGRCNALIDKALKKNAGPQLISSVHVGYAIAALAFSATYAGVLKWAPLSPQPLPALWLGLAFIVFKSQMTVNLDIHRSAGQIRRYNVLECGQTVVSLLFSVLFVYAFKLDEKRGMQSG